MQKSEFLALVQTEHQRWQALLARVPEERMQQPLAAGEMSVKDILYHIAWYERQMVDVMQQRALIGSPWWNLSLDERNALILAEGRTKSLAETLAEAHSAYAEMLSGIQSLSDDDLDHASAFAEMPPDWLPWQVIASNSYEHYPQHVVDIERFVGGDLGIDPPKQGRCL